MRQTQTQVPPEVATGVLAALGALLVSFWNIQVVLLVILVVVAGIFDMAFGARRAATVEHLYASGQESRYPEIVFSSAKMNEGAITKLLWLALYLFLGMAFDSLFVVLGDFAGNPALQFITGLTPVTVTALAFRFAYEAGSIIRNIDQTPGAKSQLWWGFRKLVDILNLRVASKEAHE